MANVHRIRLHGPWEVHAAQTTLRMTIPCTLREGGLADYAAPILFRRSFGRPTNVESHERVWLVFEGIKPVGEVSLNGEWLGRINHQGRFDVTVRLQERNELIVEIDAGDDGCGISGEVALEIETTK